MVPFISMDQRWETVPEQVEHLRSIVRNEGAKGIEDSVLQFQGLVRMNGTGPSSKPAWSWESRRLSTRDLVDPRADGASPMTFDRSSGVFLGLRLVVAHLGGRTWRQAADLARDFPDVLFDCCEIVEWLGAAYAPTPEECVQLISKIDVDRVMMGSDFPWYDITQTAATINGLPPGLRQLESNRSWVGTPSASSAFFGAPPG